MSLQVADDLKPSGARLIEVPVSESFVKPEQGTLTGRMNADSKEMDAVMPLRNRLAISYSGAENWDRQMHSM